MRTPTSLWRIALTFVVLTGAFGGLLWATLQDGTEYFKHVDEVVTNPSEWEGRALQLHGFVVPGSIERRPDTFEYRFKVQNNGRVIAASYEGIVPDTFKDEAEVVLRGRLTSHGFSTMPDGIMAKCPSKYEAASKG